MVISPTVGRVVWFWRAAPQLLSVQPEAALVTYVHSDRCVNLVCFDHNGTPFPQTSVALVQDGDPVPEAGYASWMPYQIGQAKRHAAEPAPPAA